MKKSIIFFSFCSISFLMNAQEIPIFTDFGKVFKIQNPDLILQKEKTYKVIFDVYTDGKKKNKPNPSINTVARFLTMHQQQGIALENLKVVLVLHGAATKNALNAKAYLKKYRKENPNSALLHALKQANVDIFVCGQSLYARGYKKAHTSIDVQVSLSALTALVHYQSKGYQLINFN